MAEEKKQKQEIPAMRSAFSIRGIVTSFNKVDGFEKQTKTGKGMRKIVFDVTSNEGNIHRMQIQAFQSDKVYYSGRVKDEKGEEKNVVKEVLWNDRLKFKEEGFAPIDRVAFGLSKTTNSEGKEVNDNKTMLTYDAIAEIFDKLTVGQSVYVRGSIQVEEYTANNGEKRNTSRFIPNQIYLTQEPIDFNAEDFKETALFELDAIAEEIEITGTEEATISGLVIGNRRIGRQELVFKNSDKLPEDFDLNIWLNVLRNLKAVKPYISAKFVGSIVNTVAQEAPVESGVDEWGIPKSFISPMRKAGAGGYRREFLCSGIVSEAIDKDTYTPENVEAFINQFIRANDEFGEVVSNADDFAF